jgi:cobalamin biosynthesis protein CobT
MAYGFGHVLKQQAILPLETQCNEMMDDAFGQEFIDDVEAIIKGIPKLHTTGEATEMAQQLINLLIQQQTPPSPPAQNQHQCDDEEELEQTGGQTKGDDTDEQEQAPPDDEANGQQHADHDEGEGEDNDLSTPEPDDRSQQQEGVAQAASGGNGGGNRPTPEEITQMIKIKTGYGDLSQLIQAELNEMVAGIPYDKRADTPSLPFIGKLKPGNGKLDEVEAISASSRMRAKMMGMLQAIKRQPKSFGLSGKKLVTGRLIWLAVGDPRIFSKKVETVEINTAVMVLLDLSGSMGDSYEVANAAAFALHTTLFGLKGVAVCSLEFSGKDRQPEVNLLVEFGRKPLSENFNHRPFDGTPTHNAIWAARVMLLHRPEPRKIMLVLTDGCPDSDSETKAATKRAMKDGIEIAAIGIMDDNVRHYWDNHKIIESVQELPSAMFGIMEGLLTQKVSTCGRRYAQ